MVVTTKRPPSEAGALRLQLDPELSRTAGRDRFDLLVVPPDASVAATAAALAAAADGADNRHAPELFTAAERG
jgi:hypothetical protein